MRRFLVSSFFADVTQQIHSFRASGVISAHTPFTATSDSMALRKSDGSLWIMRKIRRVSCRPTPRFSGAGPRWWVETYDVPGVRCNT
jgi:hypothetical protein